MNYGVKATKKRIRAVTSRKKKYANRLFLTFFRTAFVLVLFLCVTGVSTFIGMFKGILDSSPDFNPDSFTPSGYFSTIYNSAGEVTDTLVGSNSNRIEASYEDFPQDLIDAFVSIEDSRFWQHSGIDLRSISRAVVGVLTNNYKGGASTLTQQLIKNTVFNGGMETSKGSKIERKIQEQYLALQLTKNVDRKVILTNYLNTINLGSNTLGVKAAALRYFNKNVSDLTLSECAVIAGITQNPSKLNPISGAEANAARRKVILQAMYEQGYITKEEQEEALADDVYARIQNVDTALKENETPYSYYTDELISQVTEALKEQLGYTDTQASNLLFSGGLQIYTPQDPQIQAIVDEEVNNPANYDAARYSVEYRLSLTHPDGETQHYSQETLKTWIQQVKGQSGFDGLFNSEEEAQTAIDEYRTALTPVQQRDSAQSQGNGEDRDQRNSLPEENRHDDGHHDRIDEKKGGGDPRIHIVKTHEQRERRYGEHHSQQSQHGELPARNAQRSFLHQQQGCQQYGGKRIAVKQHGIGVYSRPVE